MMRKKRTRVVLTAALTGVFVIVFAFGAIAATGTTKTLSAIFRNIQINVDGEPLETEDEPFIVNGRTYVPLRVIGEALGAIVNWDTTTSSVNIAVNGSVDERLAEKDAEIAKLKAEIEALKNGETPGEEPSDSKSLLGLMNRLMNGFGKVGSAKISDIRTTGTEEYINVYIDVDLDDEGDAWDDLTDSKIKSWLSALCLDIQDYYSNDIEIKGTIKDIDSKDTLVTFSKYRTEPLRISYKDKDYRSGKGMDVYDVKKNLEGEWYIFDGLRFKLQSVNYNTKYAEIRLGFYSDNVSASDWDAADLNKVRAATIEVCETIANLYIEDATQSPKTVEVKFHDKKMERLLKTWKYSVYDKVFR